MREVNKNCFVETKLFNSIGIYVQTEGTGGKEGR